MKKLDINHLAQDYVREYMNKGYYLTDETVLGKDTQFVMVNGDKGCIVSLDVTWYRVRNWVGFYGYRLIVSECTNIDGTSDNFKDYNDVVFRTFYCLSMRQSDECAWFTEDWNEAWKANSKHYERFEANLSTPRYSFMSYAFDCTSDAAKKVALKFLHKQPRCKSKTIDDIKLVRKTRRNYAGLEGEGLCYQIDVNGHDYYYNIA